MIRHRSTTSPARFAWLAAAGCLAPITAAQTAASAEVKLPAPLPHMRDVKTVAPAPVPAAQVASPRTSRGAHVAPAKAADATRPARPIDFSRVYVDQPGDGAIWAHGETYKASADGRRFTYVPFLGSQAPRNFPVAFELDSVHVGGQELALGANAAPRLRGESIVVDRGPVSELYELAPRSVEQEFVFDSLPNAGDVVVRLRVDSELALRADGAGFDFANELGSVRYGKATAIDAGGRSLAMETIWDDGALVLTVPASFVAHARLPLTIDPVISTFAVDTSASDDSSPDIAYDASTGTYSVCWERIYSATDHDIWIESRDAAGNSIAGTLDTIDYTTLWWAHPRIATNALSSQFLVVAAVGNPSSAARSIWGRTREAEAPYTMGGQFQVGDPAVTSDQFDPDVGGDPELVGPTYYCVVWTRHFNGTDRDVFARLVTPTSGLLGTSNIYLDNTGSTWDINPSISKSDGYAPFGIQNWNIVWQREPSGGNAEIHGAQIHWDGLITTPSFTMPLYSVPLTWPSATPGIDIAGSRRWLVAFEANYGDRDIAYAILNGSAIAELGSLSFLENDDLFQDQVRPTAESDGRYFTIAYAEQFSTTTLDYDIYASSLYHDLGTTLLAEDHQNLAFSATYEIDPQMTSRRSGGDAAGTGLGLAWLDFSFGGAQPGGNIEGGILGSTVGGPSEYFCFGDGSAGASCPCAAGSGFAGCPNSIFSSGASLYTTGDSSVSADSLVLNGYSMPNATAVYFQGSTSTPAFVIDDGLMCTGGTVIRIGSKLNAGNASQYPTGGDAPVSVRGAIPAAAGVTRVYQCFYRNAASFCTSATSNRTNAVRVTWLP